MKRKDVVKTAKGLKGEAGHKKVIDVYNSQKPLPQGYKLKDNDHWCAAFVTVVFLLNDYIKFAECSCPRMIEKAKKAGIWQESDSYKAQEGDVVMYDWQDSGKGDNKGQADHVGVIISATDKKFTVREGNKGGTIGNRDLAYDGKYIRGFITPKYDDKTDTKPSAEKPQNEVPAKPQTEKYVVGKTYTVCVKTSLNVRTGPGTNYMVVGYNGLTPDGKNHATSYGALLPGTKVTCLEVKKDAYGNTWMKIPSGWICAEQGGNVYVK